VFAEALPGVDRVHLSVIRGGPYPGDVHFPGGPLPRPGWAVEAREMSPSHDYFLLRRT
jgi:hypothetical protein